MASRPGFIALITQLLPLACIASLAFEPAAAAPVAYPLKKSANGRYLVDALNVPFMMVGDSPQALMVNISEADADGFFADRQAHGFNTVWINLLCTTYTGGRTNSSTFDGIVPFTASLPSSSSYDLGTPNETYFAHVDRILQLAASHGLLVLLDPIETGGYLSTMVSNGLTRCRNYGHYLGNRYKNFDNILWMSGNDFQSWRTAAYDAVVLEVARGIQDNDTRHLHTVELDYPISSSLDDANWVPIIGINVTYTYAPTYGRLYQDYARANFLPNILGEARYELEGASTAMLRKQEYWSMTSGATGQVYGNHYTWQFISGWQTHLDTPGSTEMAYLTAFFALRAWYDLVPDVAHAVLTAGYGTYSTTDTLDNNDYATAASTPDGTLLVIYTPVVRSMTVNLSRFSSQVIARWYDPTNGTYVTIGGSPVANTGSGSFTPPGNNSGGDGGWVLVLETQSACSRLCGAPDECHDAGACDTHTGACLNPQKADGTVCNGGNACAVHFSCASGSCGGGSLIAVPAELQNTSVSFDKTTYSWSAVKPSSVYDVVRGSIGALPVGPGGGDEVCFGNLSQPELIDLSVPAPGTGYWYLARGTNACGAGTYGWQSGTSMRITTTCTGSGVCAVGNQGACPATDQCHVAGTCDMQAGTCSNPEKANGNVCDDGNVCTQSDACLSGGCVGANPVTCVASGPCHLAGTCDPASGACSNPPAPNGTACSDGNSCTLGDSCGNGACVPGTPVAAPPETQDLAAAADKTTFNWSAAPSATRYDVVRGAVLALPVGPGEGDEVCFGNLAGTTLTDATVPEPGTGFFYLSRGENACAIGAFGSSSDGSPRVTTTCP